MRMVQWDEEIVLHTNENLLEAPGCHIEQVWELKEDDGKVSARIFRVYVQDDELLYGGNRFDPFIDNFSHDYLIPHYPEFDQMVVLKRGNDWDDNVFMVMHY